MGRARVVHGTNYVLPPPRRAASVVNVHDLSFVRYPELVSTASLAYRDLVPRAVARADAVLALTRAAADEIAEAYGVEDSKLHVAHLGIDRGWFAPAQRPASAPSSYFLAVGTVEPRKGLDVLLKAYRSLLDAGEDVPPLVLAGQSGWGPELQRAQIPPDLLIETGFVDQESLISWVANATALVFPSRYEGFGLPPLEALAAGTPVVASDLPALREVLGSHASFVPPDDVDALREALLQTLATPPDEDARNAGLEPTPGRSRGRRPPPRPRRSITRSRTSRGTRRPILQRLSAARRASAASAVSPASATPDPRAPSRPDAAQDVGTRRWWSAVPARDQRQALRRSPA